MDWHRQYKLTKESVFQVGHDSVCQEDIIALDQLGSSFRSRRARMRCPKTPSHTISALRASSFPTRFRFLTDTTNSVQATATLCHRSWGNNDCICPSPSIISVHSPIMCQSFINWQSVAQFPANLDTSLSRIDRRRQCRTEQGCRPGSVRRLQDPERSVGTSCVNSGTHRNDA